MTVVVPVQLLISAKNTLIVQLNAKKTFSFSAENNPLGDSFLNTNPSYVC